MDINDHSSPPPGRDGTSVQDVRSFVLDGVRQVYRVAGEGPVCLVHSGGPGVHPEYLRMPALERRLTLVYIDPVGSGDSDSLPDGDYSLTRYARFAKAVLDDIGAPTAFFLGHSHGGFVALQFAIDYPDRLDGLILYDTAPVSGPELTRSATTRMASFVQRWPERLEALEAGRAWEEAVVTGTRKIDDDASHERHLNTLLPAYYADYRKTLAEAGDLTLRVRHDPNRRPVDWDVRDRLSTIDVSTLVIVGAYDFICPPRYAYELVAGRPDSRLCELRESGHFGHIEEAAAFADAVLRFIDDHKEGDTA
ncbi:alpha/beta fold hydrolase [Streptomyces tendae]|uniref:alpha/beta fold hydrolase n=1 Tax=Streptomyces tendae TaxID=1932 RepID=UPI0037A9D401